MCLTVKFLFGKALRQTTGCVTSLLKLAGLDWSVPGFSTLGRRRKTPFGEHSLSLVAGSWRKTHLSINEKIRAVELTSKTVGDAPFVGQTVHQTNC